MVKHGNNRSGFSSFVYTKYNGDIDEMKKKTLIFIGILLLVLPLYSAEQVLWDDDSNIEIYDTWRDIDGSPLTGATCNWYVYNSDGTLNQSGIPTEFLSGIINFTVNQLSIDIYPMLINCTKEGYNGTSTKDSIKIVDELSEEYKDRLVEINQTTQDIYNLLVDDINITLTSILNLTDLTYEKLLDIESDISDLDNSLTSLRTYLEDKWGNKNAEKIYDKIKDIESDIGWLKSEFYYLSTEAKEQRWLSVERKSREILDILWEKDKWWEKIYIWIIPLIVLVLLIILIVWLSKRKRKGEQYG